MSKPNQAEAASINYMAEAFMVRVDVERALRVVDLARDNAVYPETLTIANSHRIEGNAEMIESLLTGAVMMLRKALADLQALESGQKPRGPSPGSSLPFGL